MHPVHGEEGPHPCHPGLRLFPGASRYGQAGGAPGLAAPYGRCGYHAPASDTPQRCGSFQNGLRARRYAAVHAVSVRPRRRPVVFSLKAVSGLLMAAPGPGLTDRVAPGIASAAGLQDCGRPEPALPGSAPSTGLGCRFVSGRSCRAGQGPEGPQGHAAARPGPDLLCLFWREARHKGRPRPRHEGRPRVPAGPGSIRSPTTSGPCFRRGHGCDGAMVLAVRWFWLGHGSGGGKKAARLHALRHRIADASSGAEPRYPRDPAAAGAWPGPGTTARYTPGATRTIRNTVSAFEALPTLQGQNGPGQPR